MYPAVVPKEFDLSAFNNIDLQNKINNWASKLVIKNDNKTDVLTYKSPS